jgi:DMSO/TMAO reductase YedYZ molybdopterin-dependent catalytic subunit
MKRLTLTTGIIVGILLTAPLTAVLYLAERVAGVTFPAFDLFDLIAQVILPGGILTFGIDLMVETIRALNLGPTDTTAKSIEQIMAVLAFFVSGVIAGTVYFAVMRARLQEQVTLRREGLISGGVFGLLVALLTIALFLFMNNSSTAAQEVNIIWLLVAFPVWGMAHWMVYKRLATVPAEPEASVTPIDRRQFLIQVGTATAAITVVGAGLGALLGRDRATAATGFSLSLDSNGNVSAVLPNADDPVRPAPGTRPEYTPLENHYRIDITSGRPPNIDGETYRLPITGLVENPAELTLDEIRSDFEPMSMYITMACISNRIAGDLMSTTLWTGVSMQQILELVQPTPEATHIRITGADGFDEVVALDLIREDETVMLAYAWDNQPLLPRHGFPLRIHIPDRFGMKQPKWIDGMEFIDGWQEGYWVRRGWSAEALAVATSVIDTVAAEDVYNDDAGNVRVPVGGIAWTGQRGISRVEVSVDQGEWQEAEIRAPLSDRSWIIWRYDWQFEEGRHTFAVRCVEADGTPQIESSRGVRPDGATGIHSVNANL